MIRLLALSALAALTPARALAQAPAERDWSEALRTDALALHDLIATQHPGSVDRENPDFSTLNDEQLAIALRRAEAADTYGDYFYALRIYVSSFDDGHFNLGAFGNTPNVFRWPGFLTDYDNAGDIRVVRSSEDTLVPVGAKLESCDGMSADAYARSTLGTMWGRWDLESQRREWGNSLFMDESSDYIPIAKRCVFEFDGMHWDVALDWQPIATDKAFEYRFSAKARKERVFSSKQLSNGLYWFKIPSFNGEPKSEAGQALPGTIDQMRDQREAISGATAIVLDLRRNGGGSSDWSYQMAKALWGEAATADAPAGSDYAEWRVSQDNLSHLQTTYDRRKQGGALSPEVDRYFRATIEGISGALVKGEDLWREGGSKEAEPVGEESFQALSPLAAPVYVLTDFGCASACLDALDLWLALGAIHIGLPTSADTNYLEIRSYRLPSGVAGGSIPLKVHRGRPRGSNEALLPLHRFDGDISDDMAVEAWVEALVAADTNAQ